MSGFGNFAARISDPLQISIADLKNPWNFFSLFQSSDEVLLQWLRNNNLVPPLVIQCSKCDREARWRPRKTANHKLGGVYNCSARHSTSTMHNTFFEKVKLGVRDVMLFVKLYLDGLSLKTISGMVGINYSKTLVNWASMVREVMVDKVHQELQTIKFSDDVEIDESLFGRKVKHHRGAPKGSRIWIFGIVERVSNRILLYPVKDRSRDTLLPIIKKHVTPGTRIFSDGWSAYLSLNEEGYEHFVVNHKQSFTQIYENVETREQLTVHTNTIEGAWKHAKAHFKKMNGVRGMLNFEFHLCEVMYRHMFRGEFLLGAFIEDIHRIYSLVNEPAYTYQSPIFDILENGEDYRRVRVESAVECHDELSDNESTQDPFDASDHIPDAQGSIPETGSANDGASVGAHFDLIQSSTTLSSSPEHPSVPGRAEGVSLMTTSSEPQPSTSAAATSVAKKRRSPPRSKRGLACPKQWKPQKNKYHVTRQFADSDDDFY